MTADEFKSAALNGIGIMKLFAALLADKPQPILFNKKTITITPINQKTLDNIKLKTAIKFALLNSIVTSVGKMATTISEVSNLKFPISFDKDGKPTGYEQIGGPTYEKASENIKTLMSFFVKEAVRQANSLENVRRRNIGKIGKVFESIAPISNMVSAIKDLADGNVAIYAKAPDGSIKIDKDGNPIVTGYTPLNEWITKSGSKIESNIRILLSSVINAMVNFQKNNKVALDGAKKFSTDYIQPIDELINVVNNIATGDTKDVNNFKEEVWQVNSMMKHISEADTNKLKMTRDIFKSMADISKKTNGQFEKLAKALDGRLVETLQKLEKTLEDLKDGIDVNVPEKQEKRGIFSSDLLSKNNKKQTSIPKPKSTKVETVKTDEEVKRLLNEIKNGINKLAGAVQSTGSRNSIRVENK